MCQCVCVSSKLGDSFISDSFISSSGGGDVSGKSHSIGIGCYSSSASKDGDGKVNWKMGIGEDGSAGCDDGLHCFRLT